jgi:hypothetical protein
MLTTETLPGKSSVPHRLELMLSNTSRAGAADVILEALSSLYRPRVVTASALWHGRGHDDRDLLRRKLQCRPLNLAGEVPGDASLRNGYHHFRERTGHHKITLA